MREVEHEVGHIWTKTSVVDEEAIDHEREIGIVEVTNEAVNVRVAQREDFDLLVKPVAVRTSPARITVGRVFEMNADQARRLAQFLVHAADRADTIDRLTGTSPRPRLVVEG